MEKISLDLVKIIEKHTNGKMVSMFFISINTDKWVRVTEYLLK